MPAKKLVRLGVDPNVEVSSQKCVHSVIKLDYILQSGKNDARPYLDIKIFGQEFRALLDSGASHTVLGQDGLNALGNISKIIKPTKNRWVETADAQKHAIMGRITVPITLEGRTRNLSVLVVPNLKHSLILGIDFWSEMQLVTDLHNKTWKFSTEEPTLFSLDLKQGIQSTELLSSSDRQQLEEIVEQHFKNQGSTLGHTTLVEHVIDTGNNQPIKQRYYPMSPARLNLVYQELEKMLAIGVVSPSRSAWSSPIVLVDKPDGSTRLCVDMRKVNAVTKRDAYPLPRVTTILDRLRDAKYLSSLDIKSAYWQIPLNKESKEKTAFTVPGRGLFEFNMMPFGLHNAPATWQRFIDAIIGADLEPNVFVYLDDIIIVTPTLDRHLEVLREVLKRLREANLTLNKEKCRFCLPELRYLGYVVDHNGLRVDPEKVAAIINIPIPKSQKAVRQFCGTASWYRRFIKNFASRMHPLTMLLKKKQRFEWTEAAQQAFMDIRSCLVKAPILSCPDFTKEFVISCDASGVGLGAVLSQQGEQGENVIAYASRTLTKGEQKYSATERECLAVIWAVEKFRPYVEGSPFTVITDHYSLLWLHNLKDPQGRLARWALRLQPYDFKLVHRKGKEHVVPDLLSRALPCDENAVAVVEAKQDCDKVDGWYQKMMDAVKRIPEDYPNWRAEDDTLWKRTSEWMRRWTGEDEWKKVVPKNLRSDVLRQYHDAPTAGHQGVNRTYARIQTKYYWPKMKQDVARYVKRCRVCQQSKFDQQKPAGLMGDHRGVTKPWVMISADLLGPLPRSSSGYKYLLVVQDTFTKFPLLFPLRAATASAVARHLENDVFLIFGVPTYIIVDNGAEFTGKSVKSLANDYKVKILYNPSRHAQSNPTERLNKTLGAMLRSYVGENHRSWDLNIPKLAFALRAAKSETTGFSPAFLNFGRELNAVNENADFDNSLNHVPDVIGQEGYGKKLVELKKIFAEVGTRLEKAHQRSAERYNLRRRHQEYHVGDLVWKRNFPQSDAANFYAAKLAPRFTGPFKINSKVSPTTYQLTDDQEKDAGRWHVVDLKPYI